MKKIIQVSGKESGGGSGGGMVAPRARVMVENFIEKKDDEYGIGPYRESLSFEDWKGYQGN